LCVIDCFSVSGFTSVLLSCLSCFFHRSQTMLGSSLLVMSSTSRSSKTTREVLSCCKSFFWESFLFPFHFHRTILSV
jgi:hypothetical protein